MRGQRRRGEGRVRMNFSCMRITEVSPIFILIFLTFVCSPRMDVLMLRSEERERERESQREKEVIYSFIRIRLLRIININYIFN